MRPGVAEPAREEFALALVDLAGRLGRMEIAWAGGPVGLAAAAHLVRCGIRPAILERGESVGAAMLDRLPTGRRRIERRFLDVLHAMREALGQTPGSPGMCAVAVPVGLVPVTRASSSAMP